ncbi:hypothetical protein, partial [Sphingomonas sp. 1F27F7B]|uniref:hypothetical protein n=1 Tax=Sphingomonas sp. 1F27F7B TaxID=2502186 RepID=UPI001BB16954
MGQGSRRAGFSDAGDDEALRRIASRSLIGEDHASMAYLVLFLGGALLCNAIPHLAAGLRGEPFP